MVVIHEYELQSYIDSIIFVTDRGTNMKAALSDYTRYNCINHITNNVIAHAIEPIKDLISKVSRVVKYMKVNGLNSKLSKKLESYVPTRWHTLHDMFDSFILLYEEIGPKIVSADITDVFDEIPYNELVCIRDYLGPYKYVSKETEGDKDVTCVKILPLIEIILTHNQRKSGDLNAVRQMRSVAKTYIENDILPALPTDYKQWAFFHPAWKKMDSFKTVSHSVIFNQVKASITNFQIQAETQQEEPIIEEGSKSIFAKLQDNCTSVPLSYNSAETEIADYINCNVPNALNLNLIDWWEQNQEKYPRLYKKFLRIAPIVASSASAERMFSTASNILTAKRCRLSPEHVEQLLF